MKGISLLNNLSRLNQEMFALFQEKLCSLVIHHSIACHHETQFQNLYFQRFLQELQSLRSVKGDLLLSRQSQLAAEIEWKVQIHTAEAKVAQLRLLLANKEDQLQYQFSHGKLTKESRPYKQNFKSLDQQTSVISKIIEQMIDRDQMEDEIAALENKVKINSEESSFMNLLPQQMSTPALKMILRQQQRSKSLLDEYNKLELQLSQVKKQHRKQIKQYKKLSLKGNLQKRQLKHQRSCVTIMSTTDDDEPL